MQSPTYTTTLSNQQDSDQSTEFTNQENLQHLSNPIAVNSKTVPHSRNVSKLNKCQFFNTQVNDSNVTGNNMYGTIDGGQPYKSTMGNNKHQKMGSMIDKDNYFTILERAYSPKQQTVLQECLHAKKPFQSRVYDKQRVHSRCSSSSSRQFKVLEDLFKNDKFKIKSF